MRFGAAVTMALVMSTLPSGSSSGIANVAPAGRSRADSLPDVAPRGGGISGDDLIRLRRKNARRKRR